MSHHKGKPVALADITQLATKLATHGFDIASLFVLNSFNGKAGYTLAQDEQ